MISEAFVLRQSYPNPFRHKTTIRYRLFVATTIKISIVNILGQKIATLAEGFKNAGQYRVDWDASAVPNGVYLIRMQTNRFSVTRKLLVVK